jgi:hypothetical protein
MDETPFKAPGSSSSRPKVARGSMHFGDQRNAASLGASMIVKIPASINANNLAVALSLIVTQPHT